MGVLQNLERDILSHCWEEDTVEATGLGIHDNDHCFGNYDIASRTTNLEIKKDFLEKLNQINTEELSLDKKIDHSILHSHLTTEIYKEEVQNFYCKNPAFYPETALYGVQQLQINYQLPIEHRVSSIINRLRDMPRFLEIGIENLKTQANEISATWIGVALDVLKNGRHFLEEIVPQFSGTVPHYFHELLDSNTQALKAVNAYESFLNELLPNAKGHFACGKDYFDFLIKEKYQLPYTSEDVLEVGQKAVQHTEKLLEEIAKELDSTKTWQELIDSYKNRYPEPEHLLQYYKQETERIRDFAVRENLISIPSAETLVIMETPIFSRGTMPYAAYVTPAPFDEQQVGYFWITPISEQMNQEEKLNKLRTHNFYEVILTAVHQAYPGQHLQFVRANAHPSIVRKTFHDSIMAEGWSFYCEQMLYTEGLYSDLETRLFQLKDQLWRDYRAIIDTKLHLGEMTYTEAVQLLMDKVQIDRDSAEAEIKRYTLNPTIAMGYLLGKLEIIKLRQEISDLEGDDFSLKRFHDDILSFGIIPVPLIRESLLMYRKQGRPVQSNSSNNDFLPY